MSEQMDFFLSGHVPAGFPRAPIMRREPQAASPIKHFIIFLGCITFHLALQRQLVIFLTNLNYLQAIIEASSWVSTPQLRRETPLHLGHLTGWAFLLGGGGFSLYSGSFFSFNCSFK